MVAGASTRGVRLAGYRLRELLLKEYRREWIYVGKRNRLDVLNVMSVAYVLAEHTGEHADSREDLEKRAKKSKDLVYRAINGSVLSRATLELFMNAFEMEDVHREQLYSLWEESAMPMVLVGTMPPAAEGNPAARTVRRYQTVQRHETYTLGADGQPIRHRTLQGIKALVDDYDTYTYTFDTNEVEIEKIHGGTPLEPYQLAGSHWAVPILLPAALKKGGVVSMEFFTLFRNEKPLDPCFRYATHQRLENIMFRVEFHPDCLPGSVNWTEWRDYREPDDVVGYTRTVTPDRENAVVHHLEAMENAVAGFTWEF